MKRYLWVCLILSQTSERVRKLVTVGKNIFFCYTHTPSIYLIKKEVKEKESFNLKNVFTEENGGWNRRRGLKNDGSYHCVPLRILLVTVLRITSGQVNCTNPTPDPDQGHFKFSTRPLTYSQVINGREDDEWFAPDPKPLSVNLLASGKLSKFWVVRRLSTMSQDPVSSPVGPIGRPFYEPYFGWFYPSIQLLLPDFFLNIFVLVFGPFVLRRTMSFCVLDLVCSLSKIIQ